MFTYTLTYKTVPDYGLYLSQLVEENSAVVSVEVNAADIKIIADQELYSGALSALDNIVPANTPILETVKKAISSAISFGNKLIVEFAAENVLLGITQAGMTHTVRVVLGPALGALQTGSLYDAIAELKAIDNADKDSTFVTDVRLLAFVNKIEEYLGITLSTSL